MDLLIDSAAGNAMFSFMDGFSGYNQIKMAPKDAEKTAFRTPMGNFYYTVMPFGLKNAGATYQRAMTAIFHDMMHKELEDYVDDRVVKSRKREEHFRVLKRVFERCRAFKLRMNPLKCAFGVSFGKFFGFPGSQQRRGRGSSQGHSHSNYETSCHNKRTEELLRKSFIYSEIHPWFGINYLYFHQVAQERAKF